MTKEEKLREKFEAWAIQIPYKFDITKFEEHESLSKSYKSYHVQCAWIGYRFAYADCEAEFKQVGYQLVPIEPTEDMEYFGNDIGDQLAMAINGENYNYDMDTANKVYKAMLEAAPKIKD